MNQLIVWLLIPVVFASANLIFPFLADVRLADAGVELVFRRRFVVRRYPFGSVRAIERISIGRAIRTGRFFEHGRRWTGRLRLHYVILDLQDGRVVTMTPRRDVEFVAEVGRRIADATRRSAGPSSVDGPAARQPPRPSPPVCLRPTARISRGCGGCAPHLLPAGAP